MYVDVNMSSKAVMQREILVADEAWLGLALLQYEHPERTSFAAHEILNRVRSEHVTPELRPGIAVHIYLHDVGNIPANPARYRMFYRLPDDSYRLFRPGDRAHSSRTGKMKPVRGQLPERYHYLLDWYDKLPPEGGTGGGLEENDPVLQMRGIGKELWADTNADDYVRALRSNWFGTERETQ
jgi:hypothetical protein